MSGTSRAAVIAGPTGKCISRSTRCFSSAIETTAPSFGQNNVQETCTIEIEARMPSETTYSSLRANLATVLDRVIDQQDTVIVRRKGARDVALIPASELAGLLETADLLRSPRNARRLMT